LHRHTFISVRWFDCQVPSFFGVFLPFIQSKIKDFSPKIDKTSSTGNWSFFAIFLPPGASSSSWSRTLNQGILKGEVSLHH
jgi:hypothetical protein